MNYKKLIIRGISYSQTQSGAYALLLEHEESSVKLPVVIGSFEAQSISLGLEKDLRSPRPLTHDLFAEFINSTNYELTSVLIYQIVDGVFFSNINFRNKIDDNPLILDARTSDAVAMAVRFNVPIYTTAEVLSDAGILLDIDNAPAQNEEILDEKDILRKCSMDDLEQLLTQAVKDEDFDAAVDIQEEIKRRNKKID